MNRPLLFTGLVLLSLGCGSSQKPTGGGGMGGSSATGTGGSSAKGGSTGSGGSSTGADQSVLERNKHPSRDGVFLQPTLTKAAAATLAPDTTFNTGAKFTG